MNETSKTLYAIYLLSITAHVLCSVIPDVIESQEDWGRDSHLCKPKLQKHVLAFEGCVTKTIFNMECTGQCFSTWKPVVLGKDDRNHCSACLPSEEYVFEKVYIVECFDRPSIPVTVKMSKKCKCRKLECKGVLG